MVEHNRSVHQSIQREVSSHADIDSRVDFGSTLPGNYGSRSNLFAAESLYPKPLAMTVPAVSATSSGFLMRHLLASVA